MTNFKEWIKAAGIRALKTFGQTAAGLISTSILLSDVNWKTLISASILAAIYSLLTSLAGLPELSNNTDQTKGVR